MPKSLARVSRKRVKIALDTTNSAHIAAIVEAAAPFARAANIIDALPGEHRRPDDSPLRDSMPGAWPSVGDVRRLRDELVRMGWKS